MASGFPISAAKVAPALVSGLKPYLAFSRTPEDPLQVSRRLSLRITFMELTLLFLRKSKMVKIDWRWEQKRESLVKKGAAVPNIRHLHLLCKLNKSTVTCRSSV